MATTTQRHRTTGLQALACAALLLAGAPSFAQTAQDHVHGHGHDVMPFDLTRTLHVFRMTDDGGTQRVVSTAQPPDPEQVRLVRQHLQMEAAQFQQGSFADPARLHGAAMPGLRELEAGASRIAISYRPLPDGAEIRFRTRDPHLVTAIHRWFGAQLSEHGAQARAE